MTSYILAYLTDLEVIDNSEGGAGGPTAEVIVGIAAVTANRDGADPIEQQLQYPHRNWYSTPDGHNILGWPNPGVGPILPSGRPWGIPIFCLPEEQMRDRLALTITVLDDDTPQAVDALLVTTDVLPAAAGALVSALATPATGEAIAAISGAVLSAVRSSWEHDVVAVHANELRREEDWGVGRTVTDVRSADGQVRFSYRVERVEIPADFRVRVRLDEAFIPFELDDETTFYSDDAHHFQPLEETVDALHTVAHGDNEYARDPDDDGHHEVHNNTIESVWSTLRNFLRPFRGVHKRYLPGYVAIFEWAYNLVSVTSAFLRTLVFPDFSALPT